MDSSLDDYIVKKNVKLATRQRGPSAGKKVTKQIISVKQRLGTKATKSNPIQVKNKTFDARQTILSKKRSIHDARQMIKTKTKTLDARQRIENSKNKTLDARERIRQKKQQKVIVTGLGKVKDGSLSTMEQYEDEDEILQCPYDKTHMVRANRLQFHLTKCRKNNEHRVSMTSQGNLLISAHNREKVWQKDQLPSKPKNYMPKIRIKNDNYQPAKRKSPLQNTTKVKAPVRKAAPIEHLEATPRTMSDRLYARIAPVQESEDGYRLLVTNLHPVVTQEDIVELFSAIGAVRKARLIKQGYAEVMYVNQEDAAMAIRKYHNRELDGVPMQVKLSRGAPPKAIARTPKPTLATVPAPVVAAPVVEDDQDVAAGPLLLGRDKKGVPGSDVEMGVIHKALFKTRSVVPIKPSPVNFTVKL